ncbi:CutA1 divalent ion tolerance protein [Methylocella tundrae]|jgi:periplasmic divalent cation tolerance protein|uniref:CutA1 divalent ion tolerance protein n=1 Tax=Methylocella tundrae TaxID=227605 RepID=A0A8B6M4J3_METTU|nr:divalent cation tolerance protein CutA [Methylocella tundrae]VTZ27768.1 CutA1 divalent ion tolerance protein [Methylocella tundrae]VTZ49230.1 CutA1 divalent ion tolerance protein [Methylocella tundrae]
MKIFYVTLNTVEEAREIARAVLERRLAVCCNWFPITCAYRWEEEIKEEPEVVLLIKTRAGYRPAVEAAIGSVVSYVNCIAEFAPDSVNAAFLDWLNRDVPEPVKS